MAYVVGSAITVALVLLVFTATLGPSARPRPLRRYAYVLSFAIAALVTPSDPESLLALFLPSIALYEAVVAISG